MKGKKLLLGAASALLCFTVNLSGALEYIQVERYSKQLLRGAASPSDKASAIVIFENSFSSANAATYFEVDLANGVIIIKNPGNYLVDFGGVGTGSKINSRDLKVLPVSSWGFSVVSDVNSDLQFLAAASVPASTVVNTPNSQFKSTEKLSAGLSKTTQITTTAANTAISLRGLNLLSSSEQVEIEAADPTKAFNPNARPANISPLALPETSAYMNITVVP